MNQSIYFICFRCRKVYRDLGELWECLKQHNRFKP